MTTTTHVQDTPTATRAPRSRAATPPAVPAPQVEPLPARVVHGTGSTLEAIQDELPTSNWPIYLGAGALVLIGAVDWPVAVGGTALYLAFKNWHPRHHGAGDVAPTG